MNHFSCLTICVDKQRKEGEQSNDNDCTICMELLIDDVTKLKCGHVYHNQCIQDWRRGSMESSKRCPLCRASFGENEINPKSKPATVVCNEDCDACDCMISIIKRLIVSLTTVTVISWNLGWLIMNWLEKSEAWFIFALVGLPGTICWLGYVVDDWRESHCCGCSKNILLGFSFIYSVLMPLIALLYVMCAEEDF